MLCFVLGKALYSHNTSLSPTGESVGSGRLLGKIYVGGGGGVEDLGSLNDFQGGRRGNQSS